MALRLCTWALSGDETAKARVADYTERLKQAGYISGDETYCENPNYKNHTYWRLPRSEVPFLFQTTTQRWFADPILSQDGQGGVIDRTMRTVFTHDHFGPSSIQQHGFYSALLIEPPAKTHEVTTDNAEVLKTEFPKVCEADGLNCAEALGEADRMTTVAWGGDAWEGARKMVFNVPNDPTHPDFREFALSIADFALLYDPRDWDAPDRLATNKDDDLGADLVNQLGSLQGMSQIFCEAVWRTDPQSLANVCGVAFESDGPKGPVYYPADPPAWLAGGAAGDSLHANRYQGDIVTDDEVAALELHLTGYRHKAAGGKDTRLAKPVAAPERPESISVDHHDPYLVNYRGAPLPLRIGDKDSDDRLSDDCAPKQMGVQGQHPMTDANGQGVPTSEVVDALAGGDFGECSRKLQIAGDLGDLGRALQSGPHQDPETPVLEAYQDERITFRLIQGAQEVQHTFNVAGQPFRRNIDQLFPQGMRPTVVSAVKSLHRQCLELRQVVRSRPREADIWSDTAPSLLRDVFASAMASGIIDSSETVDEKLAFWDYYQSAIAGCDNIEGFTFAQEIGISEHFEMQGSLRADGLGSARVASREANTRSRIEAARSGAGLEDPSVPDGSSDYLYSFGSVDSLWNGAWGLVRVFKDEETRDPATIPELNPGRAVAPVGIGTRVTRLSLDAVAQANAREAARLGEEASPVSPLVASVTGIPGGSGLDCPLPDQDNRVTIVDAVVVAFETREVFGSKGTQYGDGVVDPDGLMLALLDPAEFTGVGNAAAAMEDDRFWNGVTRDEALDQVRAVYAGGQPEPMVLRVTAGECLRLRVLNLLTTVDGGGLRDQLGDAILPKITPLNADPIMHVEQKDNQTVRIELERPEAGPAGGVRPSARLALNFGLPGLDLSRDVPQGFGYGREGVKAGTDTIASPLLASYAGRFRIGLPRSKTLSTNMRDHVEPRANARLAELLQQTPDSLVAGSGFAGSLRLIYAPNEAENALATALGEGFVMTYRSDGGLLRSFGRSSFEDAEFVASMCGTQPNCDAVELQVAIEGLADTAMRSALNDVTHWIPYAFGAVPIRSTTDMISHVQHGLFGAIVVTPQTWEAVDSDDRSCTTLIIGGQDSGYDHCRVQPPAMPGLSGQPRVYTATRPAEPAGYAALAEADDDPVRVREFVLFYQDGLNLWDDRAPEAHWTDGTKTGARTVPDCQICDDSYDLGEAGVSQTSPAFSRLLRTPGGYQIQESDDLNQHVFPDDYPLADIRKLTLKAHDGEQVVIRVVHPGGRARQRAFVMNGLGYDDLFPGFGFRNAALLAPGKAINAWLTPHVFADGDKPRVYYWHDGPTHLRAGGVWGLLEVAPAKDAP